MTSKLLKIAAWISLAVLIVLSLSHIDFRPITGMGDAAERFLAFAVVGCLFGLAYPKRVWATAVAIAVFAFGLEAMQNLSPTRHGELFDAMVKVTGGWIGVISATLGRRLAGATST